jgi:hypothetical protein
MHTGPQPVTPGTKLIVRVLQELVARERFECYGDLKEALKCRLARLKIPYDGGLIAEALDRLEEGGRRPLITTPPAAVPGPIVHVTPISQADAVRLLERFGVVVKPIAPATWTDRDKAAREEEAARQRALEMGIVL